MRAEKVHNNKRKQIGPRTRKGSSSVGISCLGGDEDHMPPQMLFVQTLCHPHFQDKRESVVDYIYPSSLYPIFCKEKSNKSLEIS